MSKLLINENPLQVLPSLAVKIGLNEAIVLQQVHYWIEKSEHVYDNKKWVYNSIKSWKEQFPFFSEKTIERIMKSLCKKGLLITGNYNHSKFDRTLWYSIDYEKLELLENSVDNFSEIISSDCPNADSQEDGTNTREYYTEITNTENKGYKDKSLYGVNIKGCKPEDSHGLCSSNDKKFDYSILDRQISKYCEELNITGDNFKLVYKVIMFYYKTYEAVEKKEHGPLNEESLKRVIDKINIPPDCMEWYNDFEMWQLMIEKHFNTEYGDCDYRICHFMNDGIISNRFYETRHLREDW